jgi:hypothetical protein
MSDVARRHRSDWDPDFLGDPEHTLELVVDRAGFPPRVSEQRVVERLDVAFTRQQEDSSGLNTGAE